MDGLSGDKHFYEVADLNDFDKSVKALESAIKRMSGLDVLIIIGAI